MVRFFTAHPLVPSPPYADHDPSHPRGRGYRPPCKMASRPIRGVNDMALELQDPPLPVWHIICTLVAWVRDPETAKLGVGRRFCAPVHYARLQVRHAGCVHHGRSSGAVQAVTDWLVCLSGQGSNRRRGCWCDGQHARRGGCGQVAPPSTQNLHLAASHCPVDHPQAYISCLFLDIHTHIHKCPDLPQPSAMEP
jgi:hypothetical protein